MITREAQEHAQFMSELLTRDELYRTVGPLLTKPDRQGLVYGQLFPPESVTGTGFLGINFLDASADLKFKLVHVAQNQTSKMPVLRREANKLIDTFSNFDSSMDIIVEKMKLANPDQDPAERRRSFLEILSRSIAEEGYQDTYTNPLGEELGIIALMLLPPDGVEQAVEEIKRARDKVGIHSPLKTEDSNIVVLIMLNRWVDKMPFEEREDVKKECQLLSEIRQQDQDKYQKVLEKGMPWILNRKPQEPNLEDYLRNKFESNYRYWGREVEELLFLINDFQRQVLNKSAITSAITPAEPEQICELIPREKLKEIPTGKEIVEAGLYWWYMFGVYLKNAVFRRRR